MTGPLARSFVDALRALEQHRDIAPIVSLFSDQARVGNAVTDRTLEGREGARQFWEEYRDSFGTCASRFHTVIEADDRIVLEWTTEGTTAAGDPFTYDGVSVLEREGDKITRFTAYFDPAALGRQLYRDAPASTPEGP